MKRLVEWAIGNSPAMNVLMIASLLIGLASMMSLRREFFPNFDLEIILVAIPYPGATPDETEEEICQRLEESLESTEGIKKITSVAREGVGYCIIELKTEVRDVQKVMAEIETEVRKNSELSKLTAGEGLDIRQISFPQSAISVGVIGPEVEGDPDLNYQRDLRTVAEEIRRELLQLPPPEPKGGLLEKLASAYRRADSRKAISLAEISASKQYQIDVEISEDTLRSYGLTLSQVAEIIAQQNRESAGGKITSARQEILVRAKSKQSTGAGIERIKIKSQPNGDVLRVGDIANVVDGFEDRTSIHRIDGRPGLEILIKRTTSEDLFAVVDAVQDYVQKKQSQMPPGYSLKTWNDSSIDVRDRLNLLTKNGAQGLLLVFIVLAIFLDLRLAFWVALGIPVAVLGAGYVLLGSGQTLNMLSMFAFLMALGIVVDDAIVIGENIYQHRQMGKSHYRAAVDGTIEVLPSVTASVATTIIAFMPMLFVSGVMGKFIAVMPLAVIAMLILSLLESTFVLPCHLAHEQNLFMRLLEVAFYPFRFLATVFHRANQFSSRLLAGFVERVYIPVLRFGLKNRPVMISVGVGMLIMATGFVAAGITPFEFFPKLDSRSIIATVVFPDGTSTLYTRDATVKIEAALEEMNQEYREKYGEDLVTNVHVGIGQVGSDRTGPTGVTDGGHVATVKAELISVDERDATSDQILQRWRDKVGEIAGTDILKYGVPAMGPGGIPIEFKLLADKRHAAELEKAVELCKQQLATYKGVTDIEDDARPGKQEFQLKIREDAKSLDVTEEDLSRTVRAAYRGEEVMRLQRGRHGFKLMVRYPKEERQSTRKFEDIWVQGTDGLERPITELAEVNVAQGYSEINRIDQNRSVTVSADVDKARGGNARNVTVDLKANFLPDLMKRFPNVAIRWEGQQQQSSESFQSLAVGFGVAMIAMFVLLTIEFRSYMQPLIIMAIIPFGGIGAILGHAVMGLDLTLFSVFGMVALTGVIVNDSIVLVDFINHRIRDGMPIDEALVEAGRRRFRPVLLTTLTTVAGLIPILLETSFQAQVLIPMAASLCFGLLTATSLILILVPIFYSVLQSAISAFGDAAGLPQNDHDDPDSDHEVPGEAGHGDHPYAVS